MEARKITIVSTKNNNKVVINSAAETLAELKRDLTAAGVDYSGMTFYEGLTKTELNEDGAILPRNVRRLNPQTQQPETTNELAFLLTNTNKNIKSGAYSRKEAYSLIKSMNLEDAVKAIFGVNYTNCSTDMLNSIIKDHEKALEAPVLDSECVDMVARAAVEQLVKALEEAYDLEDADFTIVKNILCSASKCEDKELKSPYSEDQLSEMFAGKL